MNACVPVIEYDCPRESVRVKEPANAIHDAICTDVRPRQAVAAAAKCVRALIWEGLRGWVGIARVRVYWPNRFLLAVVAACEPLLGTSRYFIGHNLRA
jgi:hypothetical protein